MKYVYMYVCLSKAVSIGLSARSRVCVCVRACVLACVFVSVCASLSV